MMKRKRLSRRRSGEMLELQDLMLVAVVIKACRRGRRTSEYQALAGVQIQVAVEMTHLSFALHFESRPLMRMLLQFLDPRVT
jgi:hypothetical protein